MDVFNTVLMELGEDETKNVDDDVAASVDDEGTWCNGDVDADFFVVAEVVGHVMEAEPVVVGETKYNVDMAAAAVDDGSEKLPHELVVGIGYADNVDDVAFVNASEHVMDAFSITVAERTGVGTSAGTAGVAVQEPDTLLRDRMTVAVLSGIAVRAAMRMAAFGVPNPAERTCIGVRV